MSDLNFKRMNCNVSEQRYLQWNIFEKPIALFLSAVCNTYQQYGNKQKRGAVKRKACIL